MRASKRCLLKCVEKVRIMLSLSLGVIFGERHKFRQFQGHLFSLGEVMYMTQCTRWSRCRMRLVFRRFGYHHSCHHSYPATMLLTPRSQILFLRAFVQLRSLLHQNSRLMNTRLVRVRFHLGNVPF